MNLDRLRSFFWRLLFPGLDLNTRCRYRFIPRYFKKGRIDTLDAGCGNGALGYAAYRLGNSVLGISNDAEQIYKCHRLFSVFKADRERLQFEVCGLYDLPKIKRFFDQIICSEVLEHIKHDDIIIRHFYDILRPGGVLHLCSPYAPHAVSNIKAVDRPEDGGHVRDGYALKTYKALLETSGFKIVRSVGLGSPMLVRIDRLMREIRNQMGDMAALPLFLITLPLQMLDCQNPDKPYSLYVQAVKRDRII